jgi:hypothetical protein
MKDFYQVECHCEADFMYQELCSVARKYVLSAIEHAIATTGSFEYRIGEKRRTLPAETSILYGLEQLENIRQHGAVCILPFEVYGPHTAPNPIGRRISVIHLMMKSGPVGSKISAAHIEAFEKSILEVEVPYIFNTIEPTFPSGDEFDRLECSLCEIDQAKDWLRRCIDITKRSKCEKSKAV